MALVITKVGVWATEIPDQPGGLANVLAAIAAAGGDLQAVIARRQPDKAGTGVVFLSPVKGKALQNAAKQAGLSPASNIATLRVEGPNRAGIGHRILKAIGDANVNVRGVSAVTIGNKFAAYIGFDNAANANAAAKAIKAADRATKAKR
jgi:hypothetical protein